MTEQSKGLLLTPEELEQGISDYYWSEEMPMDTGISRASYAVALAQLAKSKPIIEKEERERIEKNLTLCRDPEGDIYYISKLRWQTLKETQNDGQLGYNKV